MKLPDATWTGSDQKASTRPQHVPTLLIVDDDPVIRSLMRDALEDNGFIVVEAENGIEA